tara:strand:+ start:480 stop:974 length:495 start_codon:yes stop_codon:yes gene_type:complete
MQKIKTRLWNLDKDYDTIKLWWKEYDWTSPPKDCLPPDGIIVEYNNIPICCTGIYFGLGCKFAFMEWVLVDKKQDSKIRYECLKKCLDSIFQLAKVKGYKLIGHTTSESKLYDRYEKDHGMIKVDPILTGFLKIITNNNEFKTVDDIDFMVGDEYYKEINNRRI